MEFLGSVFGDARDWSPRTRTDVISAGNFVIEPYSPIDDPMDPPRRKL
jgi:hypothetical protein